MTWTIAFDSGWFADADVMTRQVTIACDSCYFCVTFCDSFQFDLFLNIFICFSHHLKNESRCFVLCELNIKCCSLLFEIAHLFLSISIVETPLSKAHAYGTRTWNERICFGFVKIEPYSCGDWVESGLKQRAKHVTVRRNYVRRRYHNSCPQDDSQSQHV